MGTQAAHHSQNTHTECRIFYTLYDMGGFGYIKEKSAGFWSIFAIWPAKPLQNAKNARQKTAGRKAETKCCDFIHLPRFSALCLP